MRKIFTLLIAVLASIGTMRAMGEVKVGNLYYYLDSYSREAIVTSNPDGDYSGDITIPAYIYVDDIKYKVLSIGGQAFSGCTGLTSIKITDGIKGIYSNAFEGCSGLTSLTIPNSVVSIGEKAFYKCSGLNTISIGDNVTTIGDYAFDECTELSGELIIPNSVTSIGFRAFHNCTRLTSVILGNSVSDMDSQAFAQCSGLTSLVINDGCSKVGDNAFCYCTGLTSIDFPNSITDIGIFSFYGCTGLTQVTIGSGVESIGMQAFENCTALTNIEIPNSVTSIGDYAFYGCSGLTNVTIGNGVTNILTHTFQKCSKLTNITIGESVTKIADAAFLGCNKLTSVTWNARRCANFTSYSTPFYYNDIRYPDLKFNILSHITSVTFGENVETIPDYLCWNMNNLQSVIIPGNVTSIGKSAFCGCSYLKELTIEDGVISIGEDAFYQCNRLQGELIIPNSVTTIGRQAFYWCNYITSVHIGSRVESIGYSAFEKCPNITTIVVDNGNVKYDSRDNCNAIIETASNTLISGCKSTTIPNSVTSIGGSAFKECTGLTSIIIPNSVTSIGRSAFYKCTGLMTVTFGDNIADIESFAFDECKNLTNVEISSTVSNIGDGAFFYCSSLSSIEVSESNANYASVDGVLYTKDITELMQYPSGKSGKLTIPHSVDSIRMYAVSYCPGLSSIICEAFTPPACATNAFYQMDKSIPLYVPAESVEAYQTADVWKDFTNIQAIQKYVVTFEDWDNTILKRDTVNENESATPPLDPSREGYTFSGWDKDFSNVTEKMTVTAQYDINYYRITFLNWNGDSITEQSIAYNQAAEAPELPEREGYVFKGWTADIEHITARTFAIALYDKEGIEVTYKAEDGATLFTEQADLHIPTAPSIDGKSFAGWLTENIDKNGIVLRATYTVDSPTEEEDVTVVPSTNSAEVNFPYVTGAVTYMFVIRQLNGNIVCKIMFDATGRLLGIAFAPGRNNAPQQAQSAGFQFTVEGLDASTTYEYEFVAHDEDDAVIETLTGSFTTIAEIPTDLGDVQGNNVQCTKVIANDQVLILRGEKVYTTQGQEVK